MSARSKRTHAAVASLLVIALTPTLGLSADSKTPTIARFLSPDGCLLDDDYRPNPEAQTFFVVHGFRDRGDSAASLLQANAIHTRFPTANVIVVDWRVPPEPKREKVASGFCALKALTGLYTDYTRAVGTAGLAGREIAAWMKAKDIAPSRTTISGHSLGAQIAAFASNQCARPELFHEPIRTILAADPAGPSFQNEPPENRLDRTDAREVIVVHTTAVLGDENEVGALDIYVSWSRTDDAPDFIQQHSQARELITASFRDPELANTDGTPFGANASGFAFSERRRLTFHPDRVLEATPTEVVATPMINGNSS